MDTDQVFREFIAEKKGCLLADNTIAFYEYTLTPFVAWLGSDPLNAAAVRSYKAHISSNGFKPSTYQAIIRGIRVLVNFAADAGYIEPFKISMPRAPEVLQPVLDASELKKVINACVRPRDNAMILVFADTGMRRSEVSALRWDDVDLETGKLIIREAKGKRFRSAFVSQRTLKALKRHYKKSSENPVFKLSSGGLLSFFRRLSERSGIYVRPHVLRRSFATLFLRSGGGVHILQKLLGHSDIQTTMKYVYLIDEDLQEAHEQFSPLNLL
jgi:integrase/recombinase XerD